MGTERTEEVVDGYSVVNSGVSAQKKMGSAQGMIMGMQRQEAEFSRCS